MILSSRSVIAAIRHVIGNNKAPSSLHRQSHFRYFRQSLTRVKYVIWLKEHAIFIKIFGILWNMTVLILDCKIYKFLGWCCENRYFVIGKYTQVQTLTVAYVFTNSRFGMFLTAFYEFNKNKPYEENIATSLIYAKLFYWLVNKTYAI